MMGLGFLVLAGGGVLLYAGFKDFDPRCVVMLPFGGKPCQKQTSATPSSGDKLNPPNPPSLFPWV